MKFTTVLMQGTAKVVCLLIASGVVLQPPVISTASPVNHALAPKSPMPNAAALFLARRIYKAFQDGAVTHETLSERFKTDPAWGPAFENCLYWDGVLYVPRTASSGGGFLQVRPVRGPGRLMAGEGFQTELEFPELNPLDAAENPTKEPEVWENIARGYLEYQKYPQALGALLTGYQGDYERVVKYYENLTDKALHQFRDKVGLVRELAFLQMASERSLGLDKALSTLRTMVYKAARNGDPEKDMRWFIRDLEGGDLNSVLGRLNKPKNQWIAWRRMYLAYTYLRWAKPDKAMGILIEALQRNPKDIHAWRLLAKVLDQQRQGGKAAWIRGRVDRGIPEGMNYQIVQTLISSVRGEDKTVSGETIDPSRWEYWENRDIYEDHNVPGKVLVRCPDGLFRAQGGGLTYSSAQRIQRRDQRIALELETLQDTGMSRKDRGNAAHFLAQYLAPRDKAAEILGPVIKDLAKELKEIEAQIKSGRVDPEEGKEAFLEQLDLLGKIPRPETARALMSYVAEGPPDEYRAYASRELATRFADQWPAEWLGDAQVQQMQVCLQGLLGDSEIADARDGRNDGEAIFHNLVSVWGQTRNRQMVDFFLDVLSNDKWKTTTGMAATALRDSWVLWGGAQPTILHAWVSNLQGIALDDSQDMVKRALAIGALAGVKEEAAGVQAIAQILKDPRKGRYLRLKALEVIALYAKRGDLSTLLMAKKIEPSVLLEFLGATLSQLEKGHAQVALGLLVPGQTETTVNVVDFTELAGLLLSVLARDGHLQGPQWADICRNHGSILEKLFENTLPKGPVPAEVLEEGAVQRTNLEEVLKVNKAAGKVPRPRAAQAFRLRGMAVETRYRPKHRVEAFPLSEYYGLDTPFVKELVETHDPHLAFLRGLFTDLSIWKLSQSDFAISPFGSRCMGALKKEIGVFYEPIRQMGGRIARIRRGEEPYGLELWKYIIGLFKHFRQQHAKGILSNPYALSIWQRDMADLVISAFLDEWSVDSPPNRPFLRIKLLHALEILPKDVFAKGYPDSSAVTVGDRWMIAPDTLFRLGKNLPWDVTTLAHEAQHWLRGSDDIGMLGAAVLYGLDHELQFLLAAPLAAGWPLEEELQKAWAAGTLTPAAKSLMSREFQEGVKLATDKTVKGPKAALLRVFHSFKYPVDDWSAKEIIAARRLLPGEEVTAVTASGKEYRHTDTYKEGAKLAGYLMALSTRAGLFGAWQLFGELIVRQPAKYYKVSRKDRLNPAEAYLAVCVMAALAKDHQDILQKALAEIRPLVQESITREGVPPERAVGMDRRIAAKIEEFIKRDILESRLDEESTYADIEAKAKEIVSATRASISGPSFKSRVILSVTYDLTAPRPRPGPFASALWDRVRQEALLNQQL